jgi:hypothetical protein
MDSTPLYVTTAKKVPSQFLRRWLAEQLSLEAWDWRTMPGNDMEDRLPALRALFSPEPTPSARLGFLAA